MATRQNLIDTYNANPTLQSRYTLQQYLDLFGFGATTTPTQTPTTTPTQTPATPGIPNIINQNLNPGGGGDGGPSNVPEPVQYFDKTYTGATFPDGTPIMSGFEETESGLIWKNDVKRKTSRTNYHGHKLESYLFRIIISGNLVAH